MPPPNTHTHSLPSPPPSRGSSHGHCAARNLSQHTGARCLPLCARSPSRTRRHCTVWQAKFVHQILDAVSIVSCIGDREVEHGGDAYTVNVGGDDFEDAMLTQTAGPSYRHIIDLNATDRSLFINPLGQNGNQLSTHYDNLLDMWSTGKYLRMHTTDYDAGSTSVVIAQSP